MAMLEDGLGMSAIQVDQPDVPAGRRNVAPLERPSFDFK